MRVLKPVECTPSNVNPKVNSEPWVIMVCQVGLPVVNKGTTSSGVVANEGGAACVRAGSIMRNLYFSLNFAVNLKLL